MGVYLPGENFATQGPAPDGFHVPLNTEWEGLKTIMDGLSLTTGNNWRINLHMPFAGIRKNDSTISGQGSQGDYWSSSPNSGQVYSKYIYLYSSGIKTNMSNSRGGGFSIRCFKDSFEKPTSSWTVINGTLGGAGIFWNQNKGLISITSNGTTGYTIQDKNLGATAVYNDGDTLTQDNMGNMYQWGNNYGFPSTGSVTTSSTQVNAQNYGPGNYYNSSTFITGNQDRSSVQNDNLRGGVDGNVPTMSELKNAYIGEYRVPGANTYMYWELVSNANDTSGNSRNGTVNGTVTWNSGAVFAGSGQISSPVNSMPSDFTISCWVNKTQNSASEQVLFAKWGSSTERGRFAMLYDGSGNLKVRNTPSESGSSWVTVGNYGYNILHNVIYVKDGLTIKVYVNGSLATTVGYYQWDNYSSSYLGIGGWTSSQSNFRGTIKDFIVENKVRTAQNVTDYYNLTKSKYGL